MRLFESVYGAIRHWSRLVAESSPDGQVVERGSALAAVLPVAPERSVVNCVTYLAPADLEKAYDEIAAAYQAIGAQWTVWVHEGDRETAALLNERGHVLDAEPAAMGRTLADPPERPELEDWTDQGSMSDVGRLNDLSYAYGTDTFARLFSSITEGHAYVARLDGKPVGCVLMVDHEGNSDVEWVAVVPEARGRGLSGKLMAHALADAAERGCATSTLVATELGRPVYERLGFETLGKLQMWERRLT